MRDPGRGAAQTYHRQGLALAASARPPAMSQVMSLEMPVAMSLARPVARPVARSVGRSVGTSVMLPLLLSSTDRPLSGAATGVGIGMAEGAEPHGTRPLKAIRAMRPIPLLVPAGHLCFCLCKAFPPRVPMPVNDHATPSNPGPSLNTVTTQSLWSTEAGPAGILNCAHMLPQAGAFGLQVCAFACWRQADETNQLQPGRKSPSLIHIYEPTQPY